MEAATPIRKKSLAEEVAGQLKQYIERNKLPEGAKLPTEPELMRLFGVGRSSVREAVRILADRGLLCVQQGRGTFVADADSDHESFAQRLKRADIRELREIRDTLEPTIAKLAALRRTEADIECMKQHIAQRRATAEAGDVPHCIAADIDFHNAVVRATHNKILAELYSSMTAHLSSGYEYIYTGTLHLLETQAIHEKLLRHIEDGNTKAAAKTAKLIWKDAKEADHA